LFISQKKIGKSEAAQQEESLTNQRDIIKQGEPFTRMFAPCQTPWLGQKTNDDAIIAKNTSCFFIALSLSGVVSCG
jgi:hypothetical protein